MIEGDASLCIVVDDPALFSTRLARAIGNAAALWVRVARECGPRCLAAGRSGARRTFACDRTCGLGDGNGLERDHPPEGGPTESARCRGSPLRANFAHCAHRRGRLAARCRFIPRQTGTMRDEIDRLSQAGSRGAAEPPENPMSADRVRWEHIQRVYELCGRNVSETARRLNMHRRTLQRILAKRAPR